MLATTFNLSTGSTGLLEPNCLSFMMFRLPTVDSWLASAFASYVSAELKFLGAGYCLRLAMNIVSIRQLLRWMA